MGEATEPTFVTVPPDAGERAIRAGVNQAPPEELHQPEDAGESNQSEDAPAEPHRASQVVPVSAWALARPFSEEEEDMTEPLIGNPEDLLLPAGGLLIMYGDGGAGKTTLTLDAICYLASGAPWLGQPVPVALKILVIENEGPRGMMRKRMRARLEAWEGEEWAERVSVWTDPWGGFNFREDWCRQAVADQVTAFEADLVIVGPMAAIGAVGGGTPDEVTEFSALLADTQSRTPLPFAYWVIHHENKAGDVSGAWERLPDTLVHVSGQGNGHTRVHWRKARWSSLHDTSMNLTWSGTFSFELDDPPPTDDDRLTQVRELFENDDVWRTVEEVKSALSIGQAGAKRALNALTDTDVLYEEKGPPGRHASSRCWRLASGVERGTDQTTMGDPPTQSDPGSPEVTSDLSGERGPVSNPPPNPEGVGVGTGVTRTGTSVGDSNPEPPTDQDSDIPF